MIKSWIAMAESVRGAAHVRSGAANQDAVSVHVPRKKGKAAIIAVSDGHGSPKCFRSAQGAQIAVQTAVETTKAFLDELSGMMPSGHKGIVETRLPPLLVREWRSRVKQHWERTAITAEERKALGLSEGSSLAGKPPYLYYGATLLVAAIAKCYMFFLQLGDGDIIAVTGEPPCAGEPLPEDPSLIANETTSLCLGNADKLFRFRYWPLHSEAPHLVLACTDGYSNAFATHSGFLQTGTDILQLSREMKTKALARNLRIWMLESSVSGSGDDVTIGMLMRRRVTKD